MSPQINRMADIRIASVLTGMEEDKKIASQSNKTQRVKIEKGHAWLIRFLPFMFGARELPWARLGQHWISGKPCYCKQHTAPDFGGDPNFACPICEVVDAMHNQAEDENDRDDFYQCQVRTSFLMYCLVIAKENDRGQQDVMSENEILTPYEFNLPKTAWNTFCIKLERSKARKGGDPNVGLLSLEDGCDLWVARDKKNTYTFDLSDDGYGPIFTNDEHYEGKLVRVWRQLKQPLVKFHDDQRLSSIADMLAERAFKEAADNLNPDRNKNRSRRSRDDDDDQNQNRGAGRTFARSSRSTDDAEEAPARQAPARQAPARQAPPAAPAPTRRVGPRPPVREAVQEAEAAPIDETDQLPGAEVPAQEQIPAEDAPAQDDVPAQDQYQEPEAPPAPVRSSRVPARVPARQPSPPPDDESAVDETDTPRVSRTAGATPRPATLPPAVSAARRAAPASVSAGRPAPPAASSRPAPARSAQVDDDPDEMPEEARDQAPPPSEQPTTVPARSSALNGRLGQRIASMQRNQG